MPISTNGILAHILTDCRGTGDGLTEKEEDTKEGQGGGDYHWKAKEGQLASLGSDFHPLGD